MKSIKMFDKYPMYFYACMELRLKLKDSVAQVKIPFNTRDDAYTYLEKNYDREFYSKFWIELD